MKVVIVTGVFVQSSVFLHSEVHFEKRMFLNHDRPSTCKWAEMTWPILINSIW